MTKDNEDALRCADRCHGLSTINDAYSEEAYRDAAAHLLRLVRDNEAKDALLRQAVGALRWPGHGADPHADLVSAIRQHLESKQ